jgi:hypothetical protein
MKSNSLCYIKTLNILKTPAGNTIGKVVLCKTLYYICKYVYNYHGCDSYWARGSYVCNFAKENEIKLLKWSDDSIQFVLNLIAKSVEQALSMEEKI